MAKLIINANDVLDAVSIQTRYRINNSGGTYVINTLSPDQLPYEINGLQDGQYEVGVRKLCSNGAYSPWVTGVTAACPQPTAFTVNKVSTNFVVNTTLAGTQTKIEVLVTNPTGGTQTYIQDLGGQTGSFNIPVGTPIAGNYTFQGRGVCNNVSIPRYVSDFLPIVTIPVTV